MTVFSLRLPATTTDLDKAVRAAGLVILVAYVVLIPLSYAIAAVSPFGMTQPREIAALRDAIDATALSRLKFADVLRRYASGDSPLAITWVRTAAYLLLISCATGGALAASALLAACRSFVADSTLRLLFRMAVAFAIANAVMYPMFTEDMWMSVVWGKMLLAGHNPYYEYFTREALAGTPLGNYTIHMTYGPLWAWTSTLVAAAARTNFALAFVASKALLFGSWTFAVWLVAAVLRERPIAERASALCFFAWWPVSVHFAVGEGHNDVAMIALVLLWIHVMSRPSQWLAAVALVASALIKYVTAPLIAVELWRGWRANRASPTKYAGVVVGSALGALVIVGGLWRDPRLFDAAVEMQGWQFLSPADALSTWLHWLRISLPLSISVALVRLAFGAVVLYHLVGYLRSPQQDRVIPLVLAVMSAVLFAGVGHVWPWFLVWVTAPAALVGRGLLWRLAVAAAAVGPFLNVFWLLPNGWPLLPLVGATFFAIVAMLTVCPGWHRIEWQRPSA